MSSVRARQIAARRTELALLAALAAVALGVPAREIAAHSDSVMFCLSKGLACPVGSILVGSANFIQEARRNRKLVGGGVRQAGVFAAAGIVALEEMVDRLAEDHANAGKLANGLMNVAGIGLDADEVETNIFHITVTKPGMTAQSLVSALAEHQVRISASDFPRIRVVTHYQVTSTDVDQVVAAFAQVLA